MAAEYRILACNSQTNEVIEEIPWISLSYGDGLNVAGSTSLVVPLRHQKITRDVIYPWQTSIYIERNGQIRKGGFVTSCTPNTSDGTLTIQAEGLLSYLAARTLNVTKTFLFSDDQTSVVAQWFIDNLLADYDIGWETDCPASGVAREWETFYSYEHREYSDIFNRISKTDSGFDYAVISDWVNGEIVDTFRTYYPQRGQRKALSWNKYQEGAPGSNIDIISAPFDGVTQANVIHMLGNGEGYGMLTATASNSNMIGPGLYPMLEAAVTDKAADIQAEVDLRAVEMLLLSQVPITTASLRLKEDDDDTSLGSFDVGDEISIVGDDGWLVLDGWWRITDYAVDVTTNGVETLNVNATRRQF